MSVQSIFRWHEGVLEPLEYCDMTATTIVAADSWLVTDGTALGLGMHRERFLGAFPSSASGNEGASGGDSTATGGGPSSGHEFWDAAIAAIPREADWFPRVELHSTGRLVFRLRSAPERHRSAVLATWTGRDPRTTPLVKGPDLDAMLRIRTTVQAEGADEAVILSPDGYVVEGAYSALLWWRGEILCGPPADLDRVDSVTARSVLALAKALGLDTHEEAVTPAELDGTELWVLSALHGIRIATSWIDGPSLAEQPGRLAAWRARLDRLRKPLA